jgi:plasmid stabilization system protein ParE
MAKWKVVLSTTAQSDRFEILQYWIHKNKSATYSKKLDTKFRKAFDLLEEYPLIGSESNYTKVLSYVVLNYKIFYIINGSTIYVLRIWDTRRNPDKLIL